MNNTENMHFLDYVADGMRKSAIELEKFQVQASLGKLEAMDAYESLKEKYKHYTHEIKDKAEHGREKLKDLQAKFQDLQVQLALGKAETIEMFEEQRKKILLAIHEVQVAIKTNPTFIKAYAFLLEALEKMKVKLDILAEQLEPSRKKVASNLSDRKKDLENAISSFKEKLNNYTGLEHKMEVFQDEMSMAYAHFKKAFVQSK